MPEHKRDDIDRRIVQAPQVDGRISNQELADKVGLSPGRACFVEAVALRPTGPGAELPQVRLLHCALQHTICVAS